MSVARKLFFGAVISILLIVDGIHASQTNDTQPATFKERFKRRHHRIKKKLKDKYAARQEEKEKEKAAKEKEEEEEGIEGATSMSRSRLKGWFKIFVVGTGKACYVKEFQRLFSREEQFGEFATSEAFVDFFGEPECETGDRGVAWGKIKASVAAAAYEKGPQCLTTVISAVITDPRHQFSKGDVSVRISGEAEGEALALCEVPDTT